MYEVTHLILIHACWQQNCQTRTSKNSNSSLRSRVPNWYFFAKKWYFLVQSGIFSYELNFFGSNCYFFATNCHFFVQSGIFLYKLFLLGLFYKLKLESRVLTVFQTQTLEIFRVFGNPNSYQWAANGRQRSKWKGRCFRSRWALNSFNLMEASM